MPANLVQLSLVGNRLIMLDKEDFSLCQHSLKSVNLSRNLLVSAKGLANCMALKELNLSENQITDEGLSVSIVGLKKLKRLDVSQNRMQSGGILSNTVAGLRGLKVMRAVNNQLRGSFVVDASRHAKLRELYLF